MRNVTGCLDRNIVSNDKSAEFQSNQENFADETEAFIFKSLWNVMSKKTKRTQNLLNFSNKQANLVMHALEKNYEKACTNIYINIVGKFTFLFFLSY